MNNRSFNLDIIGDERGSLAVLEANKNVPFDIKRVYYIFGTADKIRRGFHAHRELKQLAVCVAGECKILLDDGQDKSHIHLHRPNQALPIDPMVWHEMYDFSSDCVLIVLANELYDEADYIRDYPTFLKELSA